MKKILTIFLVILTALSMATAVSAAAEKKTPVITIQDKTAAYTGEPVSIGTVSVSGAMVTVTVVYYTDKACSKMTDSSVGSAGEGEAPSESGTYYVVASTKETETCQAAVSSPAVLTITGSEEKIPDTETAGTGTPDTGTANAETADSETAGSQTEENKTVDTEPVVTKIHYEVNGGTNTSRNPASVQEGEVSIRLSDPERDGWYFLGWYADPSYLEKVTDVESHGEEEITLYAKWIPYFNQKNYQGSTYNGYPFEKAGCGPTACAMISREDPVAVGEWFTANGYATEGGSYPAGVTAYLDATGHDCVKTDYDSWLAAMQEGGRVGIVLMKTGAYTEGEHFVVVTEVDEEGNCFILDPAYAEHNGWSDEEKVSDGDEFPLTAEEFASQVEAGDCWYCDWQD